MQCVKCEEGELQKIRFKKTKKTAFTCDYCATFWMEGEIIKYNTGHALDPYTLGYDYDYAVQELSKSDQDHEPVRQVRNI